MRTKVTVLFIFAMLMLPLAALAQSLHEPHVGTSSDCAAVWHFVHNGIPGAEPGTLTAEFQNAGIVEVSANKVLNRTQHYDVELNGPDVLLGASDNIEDGRLVLSHVECVEVPTTSTTTTTIPEKESTTTTIPEKESTTTTIPEKESTTTTTVVDTTTTTEAGTTTTTVPPDTTDTTAPPILPETGIETFQLVFAGIALALLGTLALISSNEVSLRQARHRGKLSLSPISLFKKGRHMA